MWRNLNTKHFNFNFFETLTLTLLENNCLGNPVLHYVVELVIELVGILPLPALLTLMLPLRTTDLLANANIATVEKQKNEINI